MSSRVKRPLKPKSTYEKELEDPEFRKLLEIEYGELVQSEIRLSKAAQGEISTERLEALAGIRVGLAQVKEGKTSSAKNVFRRMRIKHKIPKRA